MKKIGLGTDFHYGNEKDNIRIIKTAIDLGVSFIDTAEAYSNGESERVVGKAVVNTRDKVFISTKFSPINSSYNKIIRSCENSLQRLKTDRIDLFQVHWPYPNSNHEIAKAFYFLKKSGKIINYGVSNYGKSDLFELTTLVDGLFSNQVEYNLFDKYIENQILNFCNDKSIKIIAYSPLNKGREILNNKTVRMLSRKYDRFPSEILLNWLINKKDIIVIPKTNKIKNLILNCKSDNFIMDPHDYTVLDKDRKKTHNVEPIKIIVSHEGENNRKVYTKIEQAKENKLNLCPSPIELSHTIDSSIKPVRLLKNKDKFFLVEGRVRYWAWVLKYGFHKPIPSLIYKEFKK